MNEKKYPVLLPLLLLTFAMIVEFVCRCGNTQEIENKSNIFYKINKLSRKKLKKEYVLKLEKNIKKYSKKYSIPEEIIITIIYTESSFKINASGDHGRSLGLMQTGRLARKYCKLSCGAYDSDSVDNQICLGTCWLSYAIERCKTLKAGLTAYAGGKCKAQNARVEWAVRRRFRIYRRLKNEK